MHLLLHRFRGHKFGSSFVGWLWIQISHEVAAKTSAWAPVIWRPHWGWGYISKMAHSRGCWQEASGPCHVSYLSVMTPGFPPEQVIQARAWRKPHCLSWPSTKSHTLLLMLFYSLEVSHWVQPTFKGKGIKLHLLKECQNVRICYVYICVCVCGPKLLFFFFNLYLNGITLLVFCDLQFHPTLYFWDPLILTHCISLLGLP